MATQTINASERDERFGEIVFGYLQAAERGQPLDRRRLVIDHPEFAAEIEQFLGNYDGLARLATPIRALVHPTYAASSFHDGTLGDFRLIREVGRGGMGIVYEAEQISLNRRVALKVLPFAATMDPRQLQRFRNEAQAAACLHHANIVPVHGVGVERGVHYYAMQLIEGQTLAEVIRNLTPQPPSRSGKGEEEPSPPSPLPQSQERGEIPLLPSPPASGGEGMGVRGVASTAPNALLSTKRDKTHFRHIAALIADAADALEYAHSMGVLHRDIKPGNLMLDNGGGLWITDFGLAKLANPAREGGCELTMTGDMIGTLRYMSPEAALAKHGLADHRTDIYSLGATLYELLTLRPAVTATEKHDIFRQIAWEEPTGLRKLDKSIPAELETITLKCLAKEPTYRYATAQELANDLRRFLLHEPIKARRPTLVQRVQKLGRRHKAVVTTAIVASFLFLIIGGVGVIISNERLKSEKTNALEQAAIADAVSEFLQDLLAEASPWIQADRGFSLKRNLTVKQALDRAALRVDARFRDQPRVAAAIHRAIASSYGGIGDYELCMRHQKAARDICVTHFGLYHCDTLKSIADLAGSFVNVGQPEAAVQLFEEVVAHRKVILGLDHRDTLGTMKQLAGTYRRVKRLAEGLKLHQETLALMETHFGPNDRETLGCKMGLASNYDDLGRYADALKIREQVVPLMRAKIGPENPAFLVDLDDLALSYSAHSRHAEALSVRKEALERSKVQLGPDYSNTQWFMYAVAESLVELDRGNEALPFVDECLHCSGGIDRFVGQNEKAITLRMRLFMKSKNVAGCRATVEMWERLNRTDSTSLYNAARWRAITADVIRASDGSDIGAQAATVQADRAMAWLQQAVVAGLKVDQINTSKDLDSLRMREDFQKLIDSIGAKRN